MSQQGPLPYLEVGGVEVSNAARTLEYLRKGLADTAQGKWEIGPSSPCSVLYRLHGTSPFVSPQADPAPWWNAAEPGASEFLGLVLLDIQGYDSTVARPVTPRSQGLSGGTFASQRRNPRVWRFRGALISSDDSGAEYGLRWLTSVLQECDSCDTGYLAVRLVCPPDNGSNDALGEWLSYDVALTDGPHEIEPWGPAKMRSTTDVLGNCRDFVIIEFTMTAGNPFLYKRAQTCLAPTVVGQTIDCNRLTGVCEYLFGPPGPRHCCTVAAPAKGTLGAIFTLVSPTVGMGEVLLEAYAVCPHDIANPAGSRRRRGARARPWGRGHRIRPTPTLVANSVSAVLEHQQQAFRAAPSSHLASPTLIDSGAQPVLRMSLSSVPAKSIVVVDSARRTVTVTDANGVTSDGQHLLGLPDGGGLEWLEVRDCDTIACLCARAAHPCSQGGDTTVQIQTQTREG